MNKKIKVAVDTGPLKSGDAVRGIGVHTKLLLEFLKKEKEVEVSEVDARRGDLFGCDIIHYQKFHPYFLSVPFVKKGKSVLTIHDLIYLIYPDKYPAGPKGKFIFFLQKLLVKKMDAIITISETSKKDIVRFLGIPAKKINVIYLAPRKIFKKLEMNNPLRSGNWKLEIQKRYGLPERFVLYVGDVNYNKNILALAEACKIANIPLVVVGKQAASENFDRNHPENRPLVSFLEKYGNDKEVIRLGFVNDEDLVAVYNLASVYCQPSFYEGFGLPVLEAFASGTPVVAAKTQALIEIAEGGALFCDPKDPKDIARKISTMLEDGKLRKELVNTASVIVKRFSWQKTARETIGVYEKVLEND